MYLKSIELSGFKSFAKKSELKFNWPISAIVGPNGSGKSNIAEAFRFVLGEQSIKSLRGKKGEDLIWNGTPDAPKANRASVKVIFDNRTKFLPLDFEMVTVERAVYRDGINEYLLNGSQVRLKDVIELLASVHIGSSGHHIISQGEADRILNSSTKERRIIIEDALGLKMYQYKKAESERKLEKTSENIRQVELLRREVAPHLRFLKKQVEKVEKAVELKKDLTEKASEYLKIEGEYIKQTEKHLAGVKSPLEKKEKELERALNEAKAMLEKANHKDIKTRELIELEKNLHIIRKEKDKLLRELGNLDGEINSLSRMLKKQKDLEYSYEHKQVALLAVEELAGKIEEKIKLAKLSGDFNKALDEIEKFLSDFIDHNKDRVDMSLISDVAKDIENLKNSKNKVENSLSEIKKEEDNLEKKYSSLKAEIEKEKDLNRDAEKAIFRIMSEFQEIRLRLTGLRSDEEKLNLIKEDFKREMTELGNLLGPAVLHWQDWPRVPLTPEQRTRQEERRREIEKIKIRLEETGGLGGTETLKEYTEASEREVFLEKEVSDLQKSAELLSDLIRDLDQRLSTEFKTGVEKINQQFKEYFSLMFGGGEAKLSVISTPKRIKSDVEEILESTPEESEDGIDIDVSLPKKKVKGLIQLSGGERALTSIALIFAISQVNPPPFIILDETDAALDEANSKKYGDMIENLAKFSQLIVITHNRETMSRAGILYGVTMTHGISKLLSISFDTAVSVAK